MGSVAGGAASTGAMSPCCGSGSTESSPFTSNNVCALLPFFLDNDPNHEPFFGDSPVELRTAAAPVPFPPPTISGSANTNDSAAAALFSSFKLLRGFFGLAPLFVPAQPGGFGERSVLVLPLVVERSERGMDDVVGGEGRRGKSKDVTLIRRHVKTVHVARAPHAGVFPRSFRA